MNGQQPHWEELINRSAQNYNANSPFDRESFRRDLAEGVEQGITATMSYEQRMQLAKTKGRLAWEFFVILTFFIVAGNIYDWLKPHWDSLPASIREKASTLDGDFVIHVLMGVALVYGFAKIFKFIGGLFRR